MAGFTEEGSLCPQDYFRTGCRLLPVAYTQREGYKRQEAISAENGPALCKRKDHAHFKTSRRLIRPHFPGQHHAAHRVQSRPAHRAAPP